MKHSCGGDAKVSRGQDLRRVYDEAMGTVKRQRRCAQCGEAFYTTEIDSSELAELRRRAYLFDMAKAKGEIQPRTPREIFESPIFDGGVA